MDYREIKGFISRRIRPAFTVFVLVVLAAVTISFFVPPTYMADCMLTIEQGGQRQFLGELSFLRELTSFSRTGTALDTQIELIRITPRLEQCINQLDLKDKRGEPLKPEDLLKKIDVGPYENTDIIQVRAYDRKPDTAKNIAQALADNYLQVEKNKDQQYAQAAKLLMEREVDSVRTDLDNTDEGLKDFIRRWGTIDMAEEAKVKVDALADIDKEYYTLRAQLAGVRDQKDMLKEQLDEQEPVITSATTISQNPELDELQKNLNNSEIYLAGLLTRYTETHPDVIQTRERIAETLKRIAELAAKIVSSEVKSPNPVYQQLMQQYALVVAQEQSLQGQLNSLDSVRRQKTEEALANLGDKELAYITLQRKQKTLSEIYATMQGKLVEVRIKAAATEDTGRTVKNAEVPLRPVAPNKIVNIIAGIIIGAVIAFLLALGLEFADQRLKGPEEVVRQLLLKNLGAIALPPDTEDVAFVYGGIASALSNVKEGRTVCFLTMGRPEEGMEVLSAISSYASTAGRLILAALDEKIPLDGKKTKDGLLEALIGGPVRASRHPSGFDFLAADEAYPVDLLLGDHFKRFLDAVAKDGRAFLYAPVVSHPAAVANICAACDGTVILIEPRRITLDKVRTIVEDINNAGGTVMGFVTIGK